MQLIDEASGAAAEYGKRYVERIKKAVATFFDSEDLAEVRSVEPKDYLAFEAMDQNVTTLVARSQVIVLLL